MKKLLGRFFLPQKVYKSFRDLCTAMMVRKLCKELDKIIPYSFELFGYVLRLAP